MKQIVYKLAKNVLRRQGYKIALIKSDNGTTELDGDMEWIKYIDVVGYVSKKEPLKREVVNEINKPKVPWMLKEEEVTDILKQTKPFDNLDVIEGC